MNRLDNHHNQRLPTSAKDREWRRSVMDYFCNAADEFHSDWERMDGNYALKNNQLDRDEYRRICKGLGTGVDSELYINAYNKTPTIIDALLGEEWSRPFSFNIINESPNVANRIYRQKRREVDEVIGKLFKIEIDKYTALLKLELENEQKKAQGAQIPEEEAQELMLKIEEQYKKAYNNLPEIKDIMKKYDTMSTIEEITMSRIMRMMMSRLNIKFLKNKTFEDALLAGLEAAEVVIDHKGHLPRVKPINPLNLFYEKSPDVDFIQHGDYAGYKEYLTITQVLSEMGDDITEEDYTKLSATGVLGGIRGLNHRFSHNRDAPSEWKEVQRLGQFPSGRTMTSEDFMTLDPKYGGPDQGFMGSRSVANLGLSATPQRRNASELIEVYTVYWKSQRRLGVLEYVNEYGEIDFTLVDEEFAVPKGSKKERVMQDDDSRVRVYDTWYDDSDNLYRLHWIWIPEVWKGKRVGRDIYVGVGPVAHAYQSLINPFKVKLPIHGYIYNNRNAFSVCPMDRMKPWQKVYYVIMSRFLKLIAQDRGNWTFINTMLFDKDLGVEKTMQAAEDHATLLYNPLSNAKGAGAMALTNTFKIAEKLDLSNSQLVNYYIEILRFIEQNIMSAAGMSPQRIAQTNPRMTATDNYRETMHSVNMTEPLHVAHDLLWEEILQTLMEMTLSVVSNNSGIIRGLLNDDEKTVLDLKHLDLTDNFILKVGDNSKAFKILEQSKQLAHALVQNDKASMGQLISMMEIENLAELKKEIMEIDRKHEEKVENMQKSEQAHEKDLETMRKELAEDEQRSRLDEIYLRSIMQYHTEKTKSIYSNMSFDMEKDHNSDGVADYMQLEQLQQRVNNESMKVDNQRMEIENKAEKTARELELKEKELALKAQLSAEEKAHIEKIEAARDKIAKRKTRK
jgi:hypothetical protein